MTAPAPSSALAPAAALEAVPPRRSPTARFLRRAGRNPSFMIGATVLAIIVAMALFAPLITA